ncbi:unnamed protein product [Allacma fusca]|uniref:Uncharacterized protein n=1 Tax=Allacma fusca TaxID=39272 RepID=A0A8J2Q6G0_9HEXA|nr:unnamed protein product [Allacma fusca]
MASFPGLVLTIIAVINIIQIFSSSVWAAKEDTYERILNLKSDPEDDITIFGGNDMDLDTTFRPEDLPTLCRNFYAALPKRNFNPWGGKRGGFNPWGGKRQLTNTESTNNYHGEWDNERFHAHGGYLEVEQPSYKGMEETYCKAAEEVGVPRLDLNAEFMEGCSPIYYTQKNGRRYDTYHAFLKPIQDRQNLFIRKYSHVTKILFQGAQNYAVGVEYIRHEDLESLQIKVLADRPVGKNLQDHVSSLIGPFIVDEPISVDLDKNLTVSAVLSFAKRGEGILSSSGIQATSFLVSEVAKSRNQSDWPDIQHMLLGKSVNRQADVQYSRNYNTRLEVMEKFLKEAKGKHSFQIMNILARPFSKGQIKLDGTDPLRSPHLDPNYFENGLDLNVLVEGAKRAVDLVENSPTFQALNGRLHKIAFPGCEHFSFRSDDYWECYHRHYSLTVHHPCGTCAMGKTDSPDAVVDSQLRVIGTKNLRVIDASIMPHLTTGNIHAPTIMIAEMGADIIKSTWNE